MSLALDVRFKPDTSAGDVVQAVDELESMIHEAYPDVGHIFIEIDGLGKRKHPQPDPVEPKGKIFNSGYI